MIPYGRQHIDDDDVQAVVDVLRSATLTQGPAVEAFEEAVASYVGARFAIAVASCTAGLHIAAAAAGVRPGSSLVTSPITFVASANAALYNDARPLFADIDSSTINLSPDSLREKMRENADVRAVVPVHFGGLPCDMAEIKSIADSAGALVIEDAAHAMGARYVDGRRVGSCAYSAMTVFSFHPVKTITTGEGGMITTNDEALYRRLLRLRSHGITKLDDAFEFQEQAETDGVRNVWYHELQELGFHFRITDIQCALGLSQLRKLDRFLARRRELALRYDNLLRGVPNCRPAQTIGRDRSGHHLYVLRIDFAAVGRNRAQIMKDLRDCNVVTQVHYIPVPAQPLYRRLGHRLEDYPNAAGYYREALTIPLYFDLTDAEQEHVVSTLRDLLA